jgi:glutamate/tyrosine decarboxylase-like PLP-dependent enzyme
MKLPTQGSSVEAVLATMKERKADDANWRGARTFSLVYPAGEEVDRALHEFNNLYLYENALNPFRFPSLHTMEKEVVAMTTDLLHGGEDAAGSMTSGGTESILMAVKTARDRARAERGVSKPQLLAPVSAHPAFAKAASYLGLEHVQIPLGDDLRADVDAAAKLITDQTAIVVGSAPNYPHGMIDPIPELAALAAERNIHFHTDACVGGFLLPFLEKLGHDIPPFDFRVPGVTTISADVHKYGYCTKGASVIAHRSKATAEYQMFLYDKWPGGLYGSFAMAGARPAAPIAAAWGIMNFLGVEGYCRLAGLAYTAAQKLRSGIEAIPELRVWGDPIATLIAFGSDSLDIMAIGDVMDDRGWHLDRQNGPDALHMMVSPEHARVADDFLGDLREAAADHGASRGVEARYS